MNAFERLHPSIQYHIVNSLGWPNLRPTQLDSIDPLLNGHDALVLAPTAGGKTEAAIFPVLSRKRKAIIGGLFGVAKSITEFQEKDIDLVEVEIDHTTAPSVPKSYGGVSGGALWKLHVELDASDKIVNIGKELHGVAFWQSGDPRLITRNDLPSISALKKAIADRWPEES